MRQFKFRIWDIQRKRWFKRDTLDPECGCHGWISEGANDEDAAYPMCLDYFIDNGGNKTVIVQQFTGLKDKTGREIYEGDMIKCSQVNLYGTDISLYGTVEYRGNRFCIEESPNNVEFNNNVWFQNIGRNEYDLEVIGNICEHTDIFPRTKPDEFEEEDLELDKCAQCGENAWDGYICHSCGMKDIGE